MLVWEEIYGFASPGEYERFAQYLADQVAIGVAKERAVDSSYGKGEVYGGRWFQHIETGVIWRLVSPDPPFRGLWEPVERTKPK